MAATTLNAAPGDPRRRINQHLTAYQHTRSPEHLTAVHNALRAMDSNTDRAAEELLTAVDTVLDAPLTYPEKTTALGLHRTNLTDAGRLNEILAVGDAISRRVRGHMRAYLNNRSRP
jgi:hypothetical protein